MTVEDILRQNGITDEQMKTMDQKIMSAFALVLTEAANAQADGAEKLRLQQKLYEDEIVPALNGWGNEKATLQAERDFYKTQAEGAKTAGFLPKDAPSYTAPNLDPSRDGSGRFVAGANPVPGSPGFVIGPEQIVTAVSNASWVMAEHQRLFGSPAPDDFEALMKEATSNRMGIKDYADRKYGFENKRKEMAAKKQQDHDDAIRKETRTAVEKEFFERGGSNPNLRTVQSSQYASVRKAVETGTVKDPLKMGPEERRQQTRTMIHSEIAENPASMGNA